LKTILIIAFIITTMIGGKAVFQKIYKKVPIPTPVMTPNLNYMKK